MRDHKLANTLIYNLKKTAKAFRHCFPVVAMQLIGPFSTILKKTNLYSEDPVLLNCAPSVCIYAFKNMNIETG